MTVLAFEGFEGGVSAMGATNDQLRGASGTYSIQSTTKRTGNYALRCNPTGTAVGYVDISSPASDGSSRSNNLAADRVFVRFYFRIGTMPTSSSGEPFFETRHSAGGKLRLDLKSNGTILNNTTSAVSTFAFSTNTWYRVEVFAAGDDSNGSGGITAYEVMVDGTPVLQDRQNIGNTQTALVRLGKTANKNGNSVDFYYDDVVIEDAHYPGPGGVYKLDVVSNGGTHQWTGGTNSSDYAEVDETPKDDATTYIASTGANQKSLFNLQSYSAVGIGSTDKIGAIRVNAYAARTTATASSFRPRLEFSSASKETAGASPTNGTYQEFDLLSTNRPNDNLDWTVADLANLQIGVNEASNTDPVRCTRVCAYVDVRTGVTAFPGIQSYLGTLTLQTSKAFRTFSGIGFRPKLLIFIGVSTATSGRVAGVKSLFGAYSERGGKPFSHSIANQDNISLSGNSPKVELKTWGPADWSDTSSEKYRIKILEFTDDGFRYTEDVAFTTTHYAHFLALGGDEILTSSGQFTNGTSTGSQSITGANFQPDAVLAAGGDATSVRQIASLTAFNSTSNMWSTTTYGSAGQPSAARSVQKTTKAFLMSRENATLVEADISSIDADGFTINKTTATFSGTWNWIAFKNIRVAIGTVTEPSSNGVVSVTGLSFRPRAALFTSHGYAAGTGIQADAVHAVGLAEKHGGSISNAGSLWVEKGSQNTSQRSSWIDSSNSLRFPSTAANPATIVAEGALTAFNNDGFDLTFTTSDGVQRQILYIAFGGIEPPELTTASITAIDARTATGGGNVTFDGNDTVTRGICWNTSGTPTTADSHTTDGTGTGSYSSSMTGLIPETTYYVRAYATNSKFTSYGSQVSFTTLSEGLPGSLMLLGVGT